MFNIKHHKNARLLPLCLCLVIWLLYRTSLHTSSAKTKRFESGHKRKLFKQQSLLTNVTREHYELMDQYAQEMSKPINPTFKWILLWNNAVITDGTNFRVGAGRYRLRDLGCPTWQCETTTNRTNVQQADAVVFHLRTWRKYDLPKQRLPHQPYIFWSRESPAWRQYTSNTDPMAHFFNWTMTYRWDADLVAPYGWIQPTGNIPLHPSDDQMNVYLSNPTASVNYAKGKTKMAAWLVSNCNAKSSRQEMVMQLQKYIDIDVYGRCGTLDCPKRQETYCLELVTKKHKFYMSLENSLCLDYITEKFFDMMQHPIVPIVFGYHDNHERIAPRHSFINAAKFETMKQLADYLIMLDKNDTLYNQYFWWKPHFQIRSGIEDQSYGFCHLCAALYNKTLIPPRVYHNMTEWWDTKATCVTSPLII